jgi:hypothetical protein
MKRRERPPSTLIFGGTISADAAVSIVLIVGGIFITLRP